jgi:hypothetical protein
VPAEHLIFFIYRLIFLKDKLSFSILFFLNEKDISIQLVNQ